MDLHDVQAVVRDALESLILEHWELAELRAGERTITSLMSAHIAADDRIPDHLSVDHEYIRHGILPKRIDIWDEQDLICPDIVVHQRGNDTHNILVAEVKNGVSASGRDRDKVQALIHDYDYRWAVLVALGVSTNGWFPRWEWIDKTGAIDDAPPIEGSWLTSMNGAGRAAWELGWS